MYSYPHKTAYRTFDNPIDLASRLKKVEGQKASLYFHIPFCRYKCGYCNLFSEQGCHEARIQAYLDALCRQARQVSALTGGLVFDSFAIGGGTPLLLTEGQLDKLFDAASLFGVSPDKVFTSVETSPDYAEPGILKQLKGRGVGRLSIGVQSFIPQELQAIKRNTSPLLIESALERIRQAGFFRFNIDLIYGIAGQTVDTFLSSVRKAMTCQPNEVFIYPLYVREGVAISSRADNGLLFEMYKAGRDELLRQGFKQTSMRRFVKDEAVDLEYSCGDEVMISCGCGGRSYMGDFHFATPFATSRRRIKAILDAYMQTEDFTTVHYGFVLSEEEKQRRYIIKNLMYYRGIEKEDYHRRFGEAASSFSFDALIQEGLAEDKAGFVRLTAEGLAFSDDIGPLFISGEVENLMRGYCVF